MSRKKNFIKAKPYPGKRGKAKYTKRRKGITFYSPPTNRTDGRTAQPCPSTIEAFDEMRSWSKQQLGEFGLGNWNGQNFLLPGEWSKDIPLGLPVLILNDPEEKPFTEEMREDNDTRFGFLAYGIKTIHPIIDDEEGEKQDES